MLSALQPNCSTAASQNIPDSAARRVHSGISSGSGAVRFPDGFTNILSFFLIILLCITIFAQILVIVTLCLNFLKPVNWLLPDIRAD